MILVKWVPRTKATRTDKRLHSMEKSNIYIYTYHLGLDPRKRIYSSKNKDDSKTLNKSVSLCC